MPTVLQSKTDKYMEKIVLKAVCLISALSFWACSDVPEDGTYRLDVFSTNDVHGKYYELSKVAAYVGGEREKYGEDNVLLIDVGDILQGDNAAYYYNYVDTVSEHIYVKAAEYMEYDAAVVGNHDIETGHAVYDRMVREFPMPFLAANAIDTRTGKAYFQEYAVFERGGLKVAVIGFTNPNIRHWLTPSLWSGMEFESILPGAQELVDRVIKKERPQIVIAAMHTGTGDGDPAVVENQALAALRTLEGVDFVFCAHDHKSAVIEEYRTVEGRDSLVSVLVNSGSHCREVGHAVAEVTVRDGKIVSKRLYGALVPMSSAAYDEEYLEYLKPEFDAVEAFTMQETGVAESGFDTRDALKGKALYTDLLHELQLSCVPAEISFAAPLTYDGHISRGAILYKDLFTIYPFENQLFVVRMTGEEIKAALEYSYDKWVNTVTDAQAQVLISGENPDGLHVLAVSDSPDKRTGAKSYSFLNRTYNFDSAAGIDYTVDVTEPYGNKVTILSMADGRDFHPDSSYNVAMTSYRASGGGGILEAAGIDTDRIDERVVERYPEIRVILYDYLKSRGSIPASIGEDSVHGSWRFIPEGIEKAIDADFDLVF